MHCTQRSINPVYFNNSLLWNFNSQLYKTHFNKNYDIAIEKEWILNIISAYEQKLTII